MNSDEDIDLLTKNVNPGSFIRGSVERESADLVDSPKKLPRNPKKSLSFSNENYVIPQKPKILKKNKIQIMSIGEFTDRTQLVQYKNSMRQIAALVTFVSTFIIVERIFWEPIQQGELSIQTSLQQTFGVSYEGTEGNIIKKSNFFFFLIANVQEFNLSLLIVTHLLALIYFKYSPKIAIKLIFTQSTAWYILALLQIIYHQPQPYWVDSKIVSYLCDQKYDAPSDSCYLVLMFFSSLIYFTDLEWSKRSDYRSNHLRTKTRLYYFLMGVFQIVYGFLVYISGQCFLIDLALGFVFFLMIFSMIVYLEPWLDELIVMLLENFDENKHLIFYILAFVSVGELIGSLTQNHKQEVVNLTWIQNFFKCFQESSILSRGFLGEYNDFQFGQVIGSSQTYAQCSILMCIVGISFSRFPQPHNGLSMVNQLIIQLSIVPFWIWTFFFGYISHLPFIKIIGFNSFMFNCIFCLLLYLWIFLFVGQRVIQNQNRVSVEPEGYIPIK